MRYSPLMLSTAHVSCSAIRLTRTSNVRLLAGCGIHIQWQPHLPSTRLFTTSHLLKAAKKKTPSHIHPSKPIVQNAAPASAPQLKPFRDVSPSKSNIESFTGTKGAAPSTPSPTAKTYPESLIIYHAGTGRVFFLGTVKLTAILIFVFGTFLYAPMYYYSPFEDTYKAFLVPFVAAIPLLLMNYTTAPFVVYVHLALPAWARSSQARLHKYAANLPPKAALDVTSLRWIWPRVTRLAAEDLYFHKLPMVGAMTLRRDVPQRLLAEQKWYTWRPLREFFVSGKGGKVPEKGIWEEVLDCIRRGFGKQSETKTMKIPLKEWKGSR